MPAEARVTSIWKKQKLFVAIIFLAACVPFFWDGSVGYHRKNERYVAWKGFNDSGKLDEWKAYAAQRNWHETEWTEYLKEHHLEARPPEIPFPPNKITEQYVCAGISLALGLALLVYWLQQKGRCVRTDEQAVYAPDGKRIPFDTITGLGKKKWEKKGFATVRYEMDGKKGEFLLDDYKFDYKATHQILEEIENQLLAEPLPTDPAPHTEV